MMQSDQISLNDVRFRKRFKKHNIEFLRIADEYWAGDLRNPPKFPPLPEEFRGMTCGAKTRAGTPCKRRDIWANGRCKLHGGLSTGPRTIEGKKKSALNGFAEKRKKQTP